MAVNIFGIISVIVFYVLILVLGIWAGRKRKSNPSATETEDLMLAGRNIGLFVGIFTMTATWVGGGYINGTAEALYSNGIIWCQAPFGYALSLIIGGMLFATKMRKEGYVTMLDPFQDAFGQRMGALLFVPALAGEIFWSAAILAALGSTVSVIIGLDSCSSILASAAVAIFYTLFGGLYSVAYTDVLQMFCIFIGLWMCIPFSVTHPAVGSLSFAENDWIGHVPTHLWGSYLDCAFLLMFGGIPWQVYFQRVLSSKSAHNAQLLSYVAAFGCLIMAIPPVIIGAVARVTLWNQTDYDGPLPLPDEHKSMVLPMVLQYLTPTAIQFIGLGAVSAAVMSSSDSSLLSAASMFARNVYGPLLRPKASETELIWAMRLAVFAVGTTAAILAINVQSVYGLWYLSSDLVYVLLFPQLVCVVYLRSWCNTYGSVAAYTIGLLLRVVGGETLLGLPALIHYPYYDPVDGQLFPFRTLAMIVSMATLICISQLVQRLFAASILRPKHDIFKCFHSSDNHNPPMDHSDRDHVKQADCDDNNNHMAPSFNFSTSHNAPTDDPIADL